ncbi:MAG: hypothetical protein ABS84_13655 [Rubrivivax sp. SCN 71-131]|jgi:hypothetical protein|nr:MAG: hypothetical protein ABS84_13655 [Rubrivivax sp. SCN 71-131]
MKSAVIPQVRVAPQPRAELEAVLQEGATLSGFVEASVPAEAVLAKLQAELEARRRRLDR